ncbi:hypothetical protein HZS_6994 [Henneguya salminicola]|nr:hypothetical protein HZS_6994 [Henneguya salminicola]
MISGLYDDAGLIHFHCFSAINAGQAFAGVLTAVIGLILKASIDLNFVNIVNLDSQITAILFFVTAMVFLSMSIIFYTIIINSAYYINKKATLTSVKQAHIPISFQLKKFYSIFKKKWTDSLTLFFTMSVTLMIYPVLMLSVTSTGVNKTWTSYFNSVHVFLIYNFFDFLGRYLPLILKFPKPGSIKLLILSLSRFGFIPLYFTCNRPNYKFMETLIFNDFVPILLSAIFGITNGHLITIIFGIPYSRSV